MIAIAATGDRAVNAAVAARLIIVGAVVALQAPMPARAENAVAASST